MNIVRLMHLEAGFHNPLEKNWYVDSILKGVRRMKGDVSVRKLPITIDILRQIFPTLNLNDPFDRILFGRVFPFLGSPTCSHSHTSCLTLIVTYVQMI